MTLEASAASLLRTALFADLDAAEAMALAGLLRPFTAEAGAVVAVQGAPADRLFLVDEGRLDAFVTEPEGSSELLSSVGPGDHLGEMALNHAMLRLATIRAREPTRGRVLLAEDFAALRRACEPLALKVLLRLARLLCARLRLRTAAITGAGASGVEQAPSDASPEVFDGPQRAEPVQPGDLRVLEFFGDLGDEALGALEAAMRRWQIPRGRRVTTAGTPGSSACVIVSGAVELSVQRGQRRQQLAVVGPGKWFGMVSMIDGGPRRTTCTVRDDAVVLELRAEAFQRILAAGGRLAFALVERVNRDLIASQRHANRELVRLTQTTRRGTTRPATRRRPTRATTWSGSPASSTTRG
jgi:CRP-like cAMP-binding protein